MRVWATIATCLACLLSIEGGRPVDGYNSHGTFILSPDEEQKPSWSALVEMTREGSFRLSLEERPDIPPCHEWVNTNGIGTAHHKEKMEYCCGVVNLVNGGLAYNVSKIKGCECKCPSYGEMEPFDDRVQTPLSKEDPIVKVPDKPEIDPVLNDRFKESGKDPSVRRYTDDQVGELLKDEKKKLQNWPHIPPENKRDPMTKAAMLVQEQFEQVKADFDPWGGAVRPPEKDKEMETGKFPAHGQATISVQRKVPDHQGSGMLKRKANIATYTSMAYAVAANRFLKDLRIAERGYEQYYEAMLRDHDKLLKTVKEELRDQLDPYEVLSSIYKPKDSADPTDRWYVRVCKEDSKKFEIAKVGHEEQTSGPKTTDELKAEIGTKYVKAYPDQLDGKGNMLEAIVGECADDDQDPVDGTASAKCVHCALSLQCPKLRCKKTCRKTCYKGEGGVKTRVLEACKKALNEDQMGSFSSKNPYALCYGVKDTDGQWVPNVTATEFMGYSIMGKVMKGRPAAQGKRDFYETLFKESQDFVKKHEDKFSVTCEKLDTADENLGKVKNDLEIQLSPPIEINLDRPTHDVEASSDPFDTGRPKEPPVAPGVLQPTSTAVVVHQLPVTSVIKPAPVVEPVSTVVAVHKPITPVPVKPTPTTPIAIEDRRDVTPVVTPVKPTPPTQINAIEDRRDVTPVVTPVKPTPPTQINAIEDAMRKDTDSHVKPVTKDISTVDPTPGGTDTFGRDTEEMFRNEKLTWEPRGRNKHGTTTWGKRDGGMNRSRSSHSDVGSRLHEPTRSSSNKRNSKASTNSLENRPAWRSTGGGRNSNVTGKPGSKHWNSGTPYRS